MVEIWLSSIENRIYRLRASFPDATTDLEKGGGGGEGKRTHLLFLAWPPNDSTWLDTTEKFRMGG